MEDYYNIRTLRNIVYFTMLESRYLYKQKNNKIAIETIFIIYIPFLCPQQIWLCWFKHFRTSFLSYIFQINIHVETHLGLTVWILVYNL